MDTARSSIPAVLLSATLSVSAEVVRVDGDPPGATAGGLAGRQDRLRVTELGRRGGFGFGPPAAR